MQSEDEIHSVLSPLGVVEWAFGTALRSGEPVFFSRCDPDWFAHYHRNDYLKIDPVVSVSQVTEKPIPWTHLRRMYPKNPVMLEAEDRYDLQLGFALPTARLGAASAVLRDEAAIENLPKIVDVVRMQMAGVHDQQSVLDLDLWGLHALIASGETRESVARITGLSEDTIKYKLKQLYKRRGIENPKSAVLAFFRDRNPNI